MRMHATNNAMSLIACDHICTITCDKCDKCDKCNIACDKCDIGRMRQIWYLSHMQYRIAYPVPTSSLGYAVWQISLHKECNQSSYTKCNQSPYTKCVTDLQYLPTNHSVRTYFSLPLNKKNWDTACRLPTPATTTAPPCQLSRPNSHGHISGHPCVIISHHPNPERDKPSVLRPHLRTRRQWVRTSKTTASLASKTTASLASKTTASLASKIGGPAQKMAIFQMVPKPFLSVHIFSTRCEYDILNVLLKKNDHNLTVSCLNDWYAPR